MNTTLLKKRLKIAALVAGVVVVIGGGIWYDSRGDSSPSTLSRGSKPSQSAKTVDVDPCAFLTTEDIEAATGIKNMKGHDEGVSSGTGARVCQYDTGNGKLPTLTVFARPNEYSEWDGTKTTYVEYARNNYKGADVAGAGDAAFATTNSVYVQKGDVTIEISTLVMKGFLPGHIEGEPMADLARRAGEKMPAS